MHSNIVYGICRIMCCFVVFVVVLVMISYISFHTCYSFIHLQSNPTTPVRVRSVNIKKRWNKIIPNRVHDSIYVYKKQTNISTIPDLLCFIRMDEIVWIASSFPQQIPMWTNVLDIVGVRDKSHFLSCYAAISTALTQRTTNVVKYIIRSTWNANIALQEACTI